MKLIKLTLIWLILNMLSGVEMGFAHTIPNLYIHILFNIYLNFL